jgi:1-acyl-sn-glycerol-3-phosphate acyltransferase
MALISWITDGIWFFIRGSTKDFDEFFQWIDTKFSNHKTGRMHLLVYPEGHRNLKKEPLPLRSGMIRYAFSRKMPLQMFMCSGYDEVINEKKISARWGNAVVKYKIFEPIFTDQYMNFDSLMDEIRSKFVERFNEVHNPRQTKE